MKDKVTLQICIAHGKSTVKHIYLTCTHLPLLIMWNWYHPKKQGLGDTSRPAVPYRTCTPPSQLQAFQKQFGNTIKNERETMHPVQQTSMLRCSKTKLRGSWGVLNNKCKLLENHISQSCWATEELFWSTATSQSLKQPTTGLREVLAAAMLTLRWKHKPQLTLCLQTTCKPHSEPCTLVHWFYSIFLKCFGFFHVFFSKAC